MTSQQEVQVQYIQLIEPNQLGYTAFEADRICPTVECPLSVLMIRKSLICDGHKWATR